MKHTNPIRLFFCSLIILVSTVSSAQETQAPSLGYCDGVRREAIQIYRLALGGVAQEFSELLTSLAQSMKPAERAALIRLNELEVQLRAWEERYIAASQANDPVALTAIEAEAQLLRPKFKEMSSLRAGAETSILNAIRRMVELRPSGRSGTNVFGLAVSSDRALEVSYRAMVAKSDGTYIDTQFKVTARFSGGLAQLENDHWDAQDIVGGFMRDMASDCAKVQSHIPKEEYLVHFPTDFGRRLRE